MKILCVHRYFWPDVTPQATMLRAICGRWVADGHEVTVLTSQPSYGGPAGPGRQPHREVIDGIEIRRFGLLPEQKHQMVRRSLNSAAFVARAAADIVSSHRYDMVVGLTTPPIIPALALGVAARRTGASFVYHCLDIYPEIAVANGDLREGRWSRLLRAVDARSARLAETVVVSSSDMADCQRARGVPEDRVRIVQNLDIEAFTAPETLPEDLVAPEGTRTVLFAGNLGRFQGLPVVMEAAHRLADRRDIRFLLLGHGALEDELRRTAGPLVGRSVDFAGRRSIGVARAALDAADVALVTLNHDVGRYAYPSKAISALRAGRPIVAMIESDTELGRTVAEHRLGAAVAPGDAARLARAVCDVLDGDLTSMGARSRAFYESHYDRDAVLRRWSDVATEVAARRAARRATQS